MRRSSPALPSSLTITPIPSGSHLSTVNDEPKIYAWYHEVDGANAYPAAYFVETACVYWGSAVSVLPDTSRCYIIRGEYPNARFFSIQSYDDTTPVDAIYDFQIDPDEGSINPFRDGNAYPADGDHLNYTLQLVEVSDKSEVPPKKPPNTLHVVGKSGEKGEFYVLIYRVYCNPLDRHDAVPEGYSRRAWEKQGHKPKPEILICPVNGGIPLQDIPRGVLEAQKPAQPSSVDRFFRCTDSLLSAEPEIEHAGEKIWTIGDPNSAYANSAVVYLLAHFDDSQGEVAVCRFKAPTFPNTAKGEVIDSNRQQTRYWSVCTHTPGTTTTIACIGDSDFVIDDDGYVTVVFSEKDKRPANAKNWLPLGWDKTNQRNGALVYLRNLLPSEKTFPESPYFYSEAAAWLYKPPSLAFLRALEDSGALARFAGEYYPTYWYCSKREFEHYGHTMPLVK